MAKLEMFKWCTQVQNSGAQMQTENNDRQVQFGNGYRQKASSGYNTTRRQFAIVYAGADYLKVYDFLNSHRLKPFAWTPPDGRLGIFTTQANSLSLKPVSNGVQEVNATFTEEFTSMS